MLPNTITFVDADYDFDDWFVRAKGMEHEPERGLRCTMCFDMRFERTTLYAKENGFDIITSSLGISRWKNMEQINDCDLRAASHYAGISYWTYNWRKQGGFFQNAGNQQTRTVLYAGILRLHLLLEGQQ